MVKKQFEVFELFTDLKYDTNIIFNTLTHMFE